MKYKCFCKATNHEVREPRYSNNWLAARRGIFKVYDDRVECGDWIIPYSEIEHAHIYRTKQMFIHVNVLQLISATGTYQFGFNPWANPFKYLGVKCDESEVKLGYSVFSVVFRVLLVLCLGYWVWNKLV